MVRTINLAHLNDSHPEAVEHLKNISSVMSSMNGLKGPYRQSGSKIMRLGHCAPCLSCRKT